MNFNFSFLPRISLPLPRGEVLKIHVPQGEKSRSLYGKLLKISKKKNLFLHIVSQDEGKDLAVGTKGKFSAVTGEHLLTFPSRLLFREESLVIFSPPSLFLNRKPVQPENESLSLLLPIHYRSMSSLHLQRGIWFEFSWNFLRIRTSLQIPPGTPVYLELLPPYKAESIRIQGKTISSLSLTQDLNDENSRKNERQFHRAALRFISIISLERVSPQEKRRMFRLAFLSAHSLGTN